MRADLRFAAATCFTRTGDAPSATVLGRHYAAHTARGPPSSHYTVIPFFAGHEAQLSGGRVEPSISALLDADITLVTHLSVSRLPRLAALAREWGGPLSAALFVSPTESDSVLCSQLLALDASQRNVSVHLVVDSSGAEPAKGGAPYPINLLRNEATAYATTHLVIMLDVDFQPSHGLHAALLHSLEYAHVWQNARHGLAFVLPAFQYKVTCPCDTTAVAFAAGDMRVFGTQPHRCMPIPGSKAALAVALRHRWATPFHAHFAGHLFTDNARWLREAAPYYVRWGFGFEPYVLLNRSLPGAPLYDTRFVDRGMNKVAFTAVLAARGYRFVVLPDAFVTHAWESRAAERAHRRPHNMMFAKEIYALVMREEAAITTRGAPWHAAMTASSLDVYLPATPITQGKAR
jgi:hypothetical protein